MNILFSRAPVLYDKEITQCLKKIKPEYRVQLCSRHLLLNFPSVFLSKGKKIVHINMADQIPIALLYKKLFRAKIVYSLHGTPKPLSIKMQQTPKLILIYAIQYILFKKFSHKIDKFVSCVDFIKKELKYLYGFDSDVIYYGIRKDKFFPPKDFVIAKRKISNKQFVILNVSRFTAYKDPLTFLKALFLLKKELDFEAIMINGAGNAPLYNEIMKKREEYDLENNLKVIKGRIPQNILKDYYQGSDVLVLPSITEAFGTVTSEAIACGTPTIVSNLGGPKEVAGEGGLTFKMKNPEDLCSKMKLILSNPILRQQMSKKAIQRANSFTWEKTTKEIIALYEKLG